MFGVQVMQVDCDRYGFEYVGVLDNLGYGVIV